MSHIGNTDLPLPRDGYEDHRLPTPQPLWLYGDGGSTFHSYAPRNTLHAGAHPGLDSPFEEHPGGFQQAGWYSPPASEYAESLQGDSEMLVLSAGSTTENLPATRPVDELALENARLRAVVMEMSERLTKLESAVANKTPPQPQLIRPPTTPHKRRPSRVESLTSPVSKSYTPTTTSSMGPIEAMWSPGVTPEQRHAIATSQARSSVSPAAGMSSSGSIIGHLISIPSPVATLPKASTPKPKPAIKKTRDSRVKKAPAPKKAYIPFASLGSKEKAGILTPLLEGIDPFTDTALPVSAPMPVTTQMETGTVPATAISTAGCMADEDFHALLNFTSVNDITYNHGQVDHFRGFDAATRQREALEKHDRRVGEGRRR